MAGGRGLRLEVLDYADPTRWRWRLTDAGAFVADHEVRLDTSAWQYEAFGDLGHYLRATAAPDRRLAREAELVAQVGDWIAERVLGPVAPAVARARGPVHLEVPTAAGTLAYRPWELARVRGRTLAAHRANFVVSEVPHHAQDKAGVGERLRMLAVFSLPEGVGALNLRKERYALTRLVRDIAAVNHKGIELRVLQYGATRERLEDALLEAAGWDVVHLSGHGLPAGLVLEDDAGRRDLITSTELVDLLEQATDQIKLVTLSSCESAAVTAAEHLHLLGLTPPMRDDEAAAPAGSLPAVAAEMMRRLDCAVLAMRYPVVDDFAIALSDAFYRLVLGKGQPVARALALALPQAAPTEPTAGAPPLSVATPTLFGSRAATLTLVPPAGGPVIFRDEEQNLAEFPPQPDRFVGRVGPMTRTTTALAPNSGRVGTCFHGMAGAGKTACVVELAYTHRDSFSRFAWYAAPPEGHDIGTALSNFALALGRQVPGLLLEHLVNDSAALAAALPRVTEFLEHNRVLIVLDNIESLLTANGEWRDERWEMVVDALTGHRGLSRVLLTARRRPARLPDGVLVEPVHALSLRESVLLAREWPNLCALMDAETTRNLAARVLLTVQGHPKLIELANGLAGDPARLIDRLEEAERTWLDHGTRLDAFLRDEPSASDDDYLTILAGWTRATAADLPPDTALLFRFLCCLEEEDRMRWVIEGRWPELWRRMNLPGDAPALDVTALPLFDLALVSAETDTGETRRILIHPGISESVRVGADESVIAAVDEVLGDFWLAHLATARRNESDQRLGWLVLQAARSSAPYLVRRGRWANLFSAVDLVLSRDRSIPTATAILPVLATAVHATWGTPHEDSAAHLHAKALGVLDPDRAESLLRGLLDSAVARSDFKTALVLANDLLRFCLDGRRFDEALALMEARIEYGGRSGHGPWTRLVDEIWRLQILGAQGEHQHVIDAVRRHQVTMASLPVTREGNDATVNPWNVREVLLNLGGHAAKELGLWQQALTFNTAVAECQRDRGATELDQAQTEFNNAGLLLRMGRVAQARETMRRCRQVAEKFDDVLSMGIIFTGQAEVENLLGHPDVAVRLETDALRFKYRTGNPESIAGSHHNLALYLDRTGAGKHQVWAHDFAAAIIGYQTGDGVRDAGVNSLTLALVLDDPPVELDSFSAVRAIVEEIEGVRFAELVDRLPRGAADGDAAMAEVLRLARDRIAAKHDTLCAVWDPFIAVLVIPGAGDVLDEILAEAAEVDDWRDLVTVLKRIRAGERDPSLTDGLNKLHKAIAERALAALTLV